MKARFDVALIEGCFGAPPQPVIWPSFWKQARRERRASLRKRKKRERQVSVTN